MKAVIFPNFQKNNALDCAKQLCPILLKNGIEIFMDENFRRDFSDCGNITYGCFDKLAENADLAVAIGGDGTMLKCAKHLIGTDTPLIGINTGRLGFMSTLEYDQLEQIENLRTGKYTISERMLIKAEIHTDSDVIVTEALNDISVSSQYSCITDFNIYANENLIGRYRADGVVFSTPTGSTAYSLSAGGPIVEPEMKCIEMTLICPHSLFTRPMIFSPNKLIRFENCCRRNPDMFVSVDGGKPVIMSYGSYLTVTSSEHTVKIVDMAVNNFFNSLDKKFMHPIK